jgi:hypothetical protein
MVPHIICQTNLVPATPAKLAAEGLIFDSGMLMVVITRLKQSVDWDNVRGYWFLESGFSPYAFNPTNVSLFNLPGDAQTWVLDEVLSPN